MNATRTQLLHALEEMSERYPEWRMGQMICNLTFFAKEEPDPDSAAGNIWDIEDEELIITIREHFSRRAFFEQYGHWPE